MSAEGRKYKRVKSDFNVMIIIPDAGMGLRGFTTGKTRNVSATGVLFYNDKAIEIGSVIDVKFIKPKGLDFFESTAKVVRVEMLTEGGGYEIGVQFIELTPEDEKKLDYYISPDED